MQSNGALYKVRCDSVPVFGPMRLECSYCQSHKEADTRAVRKQPETFHLSPALDLLLTGRPFYKCFLNFCFILPAI